MSPRTCGRRTTHTTLATATIVQARNQLLMSTRPLPAQLRLLRCDQRGRIRGERIDVAETSRWQGSADKRTNKMICHLRTGFHSIHHHLASCTSRRSLKAHRSIIQVKSSHHESSMKPFTRARTNPWQVSTWPQSQHNQSRLTWTTWTTFWTTTYDQSQTWSLSRKV